MIQTSRSEVHSPCPLRGAWAGSFSACLCTTMCAYRNEYLNEMSWWLSANAEMETNDSYVIWLMKRLTFRFTKKRVSIFGYCHTTTKGRLLLSSIKQGMPLLFRNTKYFLQMVRLRSLAVCQSCTCFWLQRIDKIACKSPKQHGRNHIHPIVYGWTA